ncbi:MAG TPA: hypothetical protein VEC13_00340, partial [Candidatus Paceibacterota bacterium]|nr:hypothetical protein [Candidatus Paceibacterota bacterium]
AMDQMNAAMKELRNNLPREIGGRKVVKTMDRLSGEVRDGQTGELLETRNWDKGDMLSFFFDDAERNFIHIRPSGTEPKMKVYTTIKGRLGEKTKEQIDKEAQDLETSMIQIFEELLSKIKINVY